MSVFVQGARSAILLSAVAFVAACGHPATQPAPVPAGEPSSSAVAAQPGDRVSLHVWGEPTLSGDLMVDPNGGIVLPKVGLMKVTDVPASALRDSIRTLLAAYVRDPSVDVVVQRRVVVNGAVSRPGVYFVDLNSTLRDAIAQVGGITESGSASKVSILRDGRSIMLPNWQNDTSTIADLQSGDQVVVGRRSWLAINALSVASLGLVVASFLLSLRRG